MSALLRYAPVILSVVLLVYGLMSLWLTPVRQVRIFPRWTWFLLIVLLPIAGPLIWIVAGTDKPTPASTPPAAPKAPDDDPDFLAKLAHEQQLQSWEDDLLEWELKRMQREQEELDAQKSDQGNDKTSDKSGTKSTTDNPARPEDTSSPDDTSGDPKADDDK